MGEKACLQFCSKREAHVSPVPDIKTATLAFFGWTEIWFLRVPFSVLIHLFAWFQSDARLSHEESLWCKHTQQISQEQLWINSNMEREVFKNTLEHYHFILKIRYAGLKQIVSLFTYHYSLTEISWRQTLPTSTKSYSTVSKVDMLVLPVFSPISCRSSNHTSVMTSQLQG